MGTPYAEVIGDPIAHSKSPGIHKFWLERLGMKGDYRRAHVRAAELADYLRHRRQDPDWRGCNVTIPHKQAIMPLLDLCEEQGVGAVNCVLLSEGRLVGRNTDVAGVLRGLEASDFTAPICLIGAGGAARAVVAALRQLSLGELRVVVRDSEKGERLLAGFGMKGKVYTFGEAAEALEGCAGIVNSSPLGMTGSPPMPEGLLRGLAGMKPGGFVFDAVYAPLDTELLKRGRALGFRPIDGLTMLIGQAEQAFRLFFGAEPPLRFEAELRERLTQ